MTRIMIEWLEYHSWIIHVISFKRLHQSRKDILYKIEFEVTYLKTRTSRDFGEMCENVIPCFRMSVLETHGTDLHYIHGTTYRNIEMASHCLPVIHPITTRSYCYGKVRYGYSTATNLPYRFPLIRKPFAPWRSQAPLRKRRYQITGNSIITNLRNCRMIQKYIQVNRFPILKILSHNKL